MIFMILLTNSPDLKQVLQTATFISPNLSSKLCFTGVIDPIHICDYVDLTMR